MAILSPLAARRWYNFKANRRAYWSLWIFGFLFTVCLFAEFVANDKPLLMSYNGELYSPVMHVYPETDFGGEFETEAEYSEIEVQCLIKAGGLESCLDKPEAIIEAIPSGEYQGQKITKGWMIWPIIPFAFDTHDKTVERALTPPNKKHWLGTDDQARDISARIIYGFRISTLFALFVVLFSSIIGITSGAVQGFFGGIVDLVLQRFVEMWSSIQALYVIIIISAFFTMNFWIMTILVTLFSWTALVGLVRAEFLRARNFEYTRAARALGVSDIKIMFRHILPNAMVATITMLPFLVTGAISTLATLDFLGFGLPTSYPSLGELALQARSNISATWIGFAAFFTFAIMLSLLVFIFEGVRDAFDPRKTFK